MTLLTQEEHATVFGKLSVLTQAHGGNADPQEELYLEQQLSDMFGFEVQRELEGFRLPQLAGVMVALPHLKRHPSDTLTDHALPEAQLAARRSVFGWFTEGGQLSPTGASREQYRFSVHADHLPEWSQDHDRAKAWWRYRKMIMINPYAIRAVVGVVGDIGPANWVQEQFGGSPEVIRAGEVWTPLCQGRVAMLFIHDPENQVPLGPIDLRYPTS